MSDICKEEPCGGQRTGKASSDYVEIEIDGKKLRIPKKEFDAQERFLEEQRWKKR